MDLLAHFFVNAYLKVHSTHVCTKILHNKEDSSILKVLVETFKTMDLDFEIKEKDPAPNIEEQKRPNNGRRSLLDNERPSNVLVVNNIPPPAGEIPPNPPAPVDGPAGALNALANAAIHAAGGGGPAAAAVARVRHAAQPYVPPVRAPKARKNKRPNPAQAQEDDEDQIEGDGEADDEEFKEEDIDPNEIDEMEILEKIKLNGQTSYVVLQSDGVAFVASGDDIRKTN